MNLLACDAFSRSSRMTTMAGSSPSGGGGDEDPAIAIYRRFVDTWAKDCELRIRARDVHKLHGIRSPEYGQAESETDAAVERADKIYRELCESPVTSAAGLILLFEAMRESLLIDEEGTEARALDKIAAGIRRLFSSEDLAVAEQLLSARKDVSM